MAKTKEIRSDISWHTRDKIFVKGFNLCDDLLGKISFGDMAFLTLMDRLPTPPESAMFNAIAVVLVEHGLTPSVIAARMTIAGAPEAMQAAVGAGLAGLGSVFVGSMEDAARMLQEGLPDPAAPVDIPALAARLVDDIRARKKPIPGVGHAYHKPVDPRAPRLFAIAAEHGFDGPYCKLMRAVADRAAEVLGTPLPCNATGAVGAIASELKLPWKITRGIGVMARAVGLVGHLLEESRNPIARNIKVMVEEMATEHQRQGEGDD